MVSVRSVNNILVVKYSEVRQACSLPRSQLELFLLMFCWFLCKKKPFIFSIKLNNNQVKLWSALLSVIVKMARKNKTKPSNLESGKPSANNPNGWYVRINNYMLKFLSFFCCCLNKTLLKHIHTLEKLCVFSIYNIFDFSD